LRAGFGGRSETAVSDFGGTVNGKKIEIVVADDQNKPDIGVAIALRWLDNEGVDAIVGCSASSIALAVQDIMKARKKPYLLAGTAGSFFTNDKCSPMTTQWMVDTYAQPKATVKALLAQGVDSWFFLTVDYAFGKVWQADTTNFIKAGGGTVVGSVLHPLNSSTLVFPADRASERREGDRARPTPARILPIPSSRRGSSG
jgi:branched-chain amino acid transport system substrate-binding protein